MRPEEVKAVLGEPSRTEFIANKWVWNYSLHEPWKGFVPYYLVFSKENPILESWYADQNEYYRQQELWLKAFPPTQKQENRNQIRMRREVCLGIQLVQPNQTL
jgi:hypothetical protein